MKDEFNVEDVEVLGLFISRALYNYVRITGKEINSTINGSIATLKVFFQYFVDEEYIEELENPIRRIKNLKEDKRVIVKFNDIEVFKIINDVKEETYSNIRDKLILILLFDTGIRVSELCDIKADGIARKYILIHGKRVPRSDLYISAILLGSICVDSRR